MGARCQTKQHRSFLRVIPVEYNFQPLVMTGFEARQAIDDHCDEPQDVSSGGD
jgi:hypothetical protein